MINKSIHSLDALINIIGKAKQVQTYMENFFHPEIEVENMLSVHFI